jgi:hypothetical protein
MTMMKLALYLKLSAFLSVFLLMLGSPVLGKQVHHELEWTGIKTFTTVENTTVSHLNFHGASCRFDNDFLPVYSDLIKLKNNATEIDVTLTNATFSELSYEEKMLIGQRTDIGNEIIVNAKVGYQRKQPYALVSMVPIRKNTTTGQYEKLLSFDLNVVVTKTGNPTAGVFKSFAANSVLQDGSGDWYRIAVAEDGVHKIDYTFLNAIGVDMTNLDIGAINIYGNGGGMLPENNSIFRYDDLQKNAIYIDDDNSDNKFGSADYILFYGKGPHVWELASTGTKFEHQKNYYADSAYYFININTASLNPKRITTQALSGSTVTHTVTTFNDFAYQEEDDLNLLKSGREWYGEEFDILTNYTFGFTFPNLDPAASVNVKASFVARSSTGSGSTRFVVTSGSNSDVDTITNVTGIYEYARGGGVEFLTNGSGSSILVDVDYDKMSSPSAIGWLNEIEVNATRNLTMSGNQMAFRDLQSIGVGNVGDFTLTGASSVREIWEITDPLNPTKLNVTTGSSINFAINTDSLREFIAFTNSSYKTPVSYGKIANQDLHALSFADMFIVAHPSFVNQANQLADFHREEGLTVHVVKPQQIYNEFSSGAQDITAIKTFMKMFYDRAGADTTLLPRYLLLFGDGSYDNKDRLAGNTRFIPTYQSGNSIISTASFTADDFFGLLSDNDGMGNQDLLDIGVGRIPSKSTQEAQDVVNKIIHYGRNGAATTGGHCAVGDANSTFGDWRNVVCLVADDEDNNAYFNGAEEFSDTIVKYNPEINIEKIYLDAYKQETTPGGERYPDVNEALKQRVDQGALVVNYVGHGGEVGWSHERTLDLSTIQNWENFNTLPLFMTATCEFSRFDDPARTSAGEFVLLNPNGGGMGLLTTTRLVYSGPNERLNKYFYQVAFTEPNNEPQRLGDIMRLTKNLEAVPPTNDANFRNFTLLGDPALKLAIPKHNIVTTMVNNSPVTGPIDTLKALSRVTITGHVEDYSGQKLTNFNGLVYPTVYDKELQLTTLANDPGSNGSFPANFNLRKNVIYKGKASVVNGDFTFSFVVPKDISFQFGPGRLSYYAENGTEDAHGYNEDIIIGGSDTSATADNQGPSIELYMNDDNFVVGGITDESPDLFSIVFDDNGVNTVGNGIGHDITAILDENTDNAIILNDFYESDVDTYQSGTIRYSFADLEEGPHTLSLKVWDVYNNSSEAITEFVVANSEELALDHVLNYPNPFTTKTTFFFEHNQVCSSLDVQVQVFTVSGKLVKSINTIANTEGFRIDGIDWDGRDEYGDKIGRGVYVYRVKVSTNEGEVEEKFEKLVILN